MASASIVSSLSLLRKKQKPIVHFTSPTTVFSVGEWPLVVKFSLHMISEKDLQERGNLQNAAEIKNSHFSCVDRIHLKFLFLRDLALTHTKAFWPMLKNSSIFAFPCLPCCHCKELVVVNILLLQTLEVKKRKKKSHMGTKRRAWTKPTRTTRHCVPSFMAEFLSEFHVPMEVVGRVRHLQLSFQAVRADAEDAEDKMAPSKCICDLLPLLGLGDKAWRPE